MELTTAVIEYEQEQSRIAFDKLAARNKYTRQNMMLVGRGLRKADAEQIRIMVLGAAELGMHPVSDHSLDMMVEEIKANDYGLQKRYLQKQGVIIPRREFIRATFDLYRQILLQGSRTNAYFEACRFQFGSREKMQSILESIGTAQEYFLCEMGKAIPSLEKRGVPAVGMEIGRERREQLLIDVYGHE